MIKKSQGGQATVVIIILVLVVGVFIVLQSKISPSADRETVCYMNPDSSKSLSYGGVTYELIRERAGLSTEQFKWHMKEIESIQYGSDTRILRRASTWAESQEAHPEKKQDDIAGFPQEARDLIFLEVEDPNLQEPGYVFVDIFLKKGVPIPNFIKQFCEVDKQPIEPLKIFPGADGKRFPPAYLTREGVGYTLFAYERIDSEVGRTHNGNQPHDETISIEGKQYPVGIVSFAEYLALYDNPKGLIYLYSKIIATPTPAPTGTAVNNTLQLRTFDISTLYPWGWWSPECKPAVYLYPTVKTQVSVSVSPKGYLTYTDPVYPTGGWRVEANPDGTIVSNNKKYDYLYYESKIRDSEIQKPTTGYVTKFEDLPQLYSDILPKLGLTEKETTDFKDYWEKVLPKSPYYFVGVMEESAIDRIEPLTISPKPQTIVRVRLYFEALDEKREVKAPELLSKDRTGFVVSEWGGIVKLHPGTEFSCSQ